MRSLLPNVLISTSVLLILSILSVSHAIDIEKITINRPKKIPKELPPEPDFTNKLDDDVCAGMVADHKCDDMPDLMKQFCHKACYEQVKGTLYFKRIEFDDTLTDEFFALRATNWTGSELHFEDFDGYINVIMNIGITCEEGEGAQMVEKLNTFRKLMPYTLNLLVFPHQKKHAWFDRENCTTFDELIAHRRKTLHIMDFATVNRLVEDEYAMRLDVVKEEAKVHPVFKFLKKQIDMEFLVHDRSTFFFVNPWATSMDVLQGAPLSYLKKHIDSVLMGWENEL